MRAFLIVVPTPILQLFPGVCKAQEPMGVQTFRSEAAIEGFNECIVGRLSGPGEVERDAALVSPQIQVARHELGASGRHGSWPVIPLWPPRRNVAEGPLLLPGAGAGTADRGWAADRGDGGVCAPCQIC